MRVCTVQHILPYNHILRSLTDLYFMELSTNVVKNLTMTDIYRFTPNTVVLLECSIY